MNKAALYVSILLIFFLGLHFHSSYDAHNKSVILKNGLRFINMTKGEILREFSKDITFIIKEPATKVAHMYKVDEYVGDAKWRILKTPIGFQHGSQEHYFVDVLNGDYVFQDTFERMAFEDIQLLVYDAPKIEALKLYQDVKEDGLFSYIEDSVFIFFIIAFLYLLGLLLIELPIALAQYVFKRDCRFWIYGIISLLAIRFMQLFFLPPTFPINDWVTLLRPVIIVIPTFMIYQWFKYKYRKRFDFSDQQMIKFSIILIGVFLSIHIADQIGEIMASDNKGTSITMAPFRLSMAIGFSFALGNLLFNISNYLWSMRGASKRLDIASANEKESQAALNTIQSSVNPHFLYNSLNSIAALAKIDTERTEKMTLALSAFYKYHSNREERALSTVQEEIAMLRTYLEIEKIRFEDRLQYGFEIAENIIDKKIPHFLLQPIVENAIKYGYNKSTDKINVSVTISGENDNMEIKVYDKGTPFSEQMQKGFGLKSVSSKLKMFYPDAHEIAFVNHPEKHVLISIKNSTHD